MVQKASALKQGVKHDEDKIPYHLLSPDALEQIALVLQFGAKKYSARNWEKGLLFSRVYRACLGHLFDWFRLKDLDEETALNHLAHAGCCIMFLLHYVTNYEEYKDFDDRPKQH